MTTLDIYLFTRRYFYNNNDKGLDSGTKQRGSNGSSKKNQNPQTLAQANKERAIR
jgi:hypothetical protein